MKHLTTDDIEAGLALRAEELGVRLPKGRGITRLWNAGHWVFRHVSFTLRRGETVALIGRNGSGKSTMLRTLAGILSPDEGELSFAPGLTTTVLAPGAGFDPMLTGRENLYNTALYQGYMPSAFESRIDDIIDFSEIGSWIDQPLAIYSAGMRARLGFSLSLYLPADILMIDETLSAGDGHFRDKARQAVEDLIQSNRTVILISHSTQIMERMCQRGIVLDRGKMIVQGPIGDVLDVYEQLLTGRYDSPDVGDATGEPDAEEDKEREAEVALRRPEAILQQATQALEKAKQNRELTQTARIRARDDFWLQLDALQADLEVALKNHGERVALDIHGHDGAGTEIGAALGERYRDFLEARKKLESARARDKEELSQMRDATKNWRDARTGGGDD